MGYRQVGPVRGFNNDASCRVSPSHHKWGSIFRNKKRKEWKKIKKNASSQAVAAAAVRQPPAESIIIIKEGGKRTETAFISFNPLVCAVVFCCWQANDPSHSSRSSGAETGGALGCKLYDGFFFYIYILCFWSIELQHYKHHRIHEIGGKRESWRRRLSQ